MTPTFSPKSTGQIKSIFAGVTKALRFLLVALTLPAHHSKHLNTLLSCDVHRYDFFSYLSDDGLPVPWFSSADTFATLGHPPGLPFSVSVACTGEFPQLPFLSPLLLCDFARSDNLFLPEPPSGIFLTKPTPAAVVLVAGVIVPPGIGFWRTAVTVRSCVDKEAEAGWTSPVKIG